MRRRGKSNIIPLMGILIAIIAVLGVIGWGYVQYLLSPADPKSTVKKTIIIDPGMGVNSVATLLANEGILNSPWSLRIATYLKGKRNGIQAGEFSLSPAMSPYQILEELGVGRFDLQVKILEGWRREEIADALESTFKKKNLPFDKAKFLELTKGKEGYLFPATYTIPINTTESTLVALLESTQQKKITESHRNKINKSDRTLHQILTMASIIEREARTDEARKQVSAILWKRIDEGWPLQADATLQYAKGYDRIEQTWWKPPIAKDKEIKSAYNTYTNVGLPPGPICAPSLSSIEAAINPSSNSYWFYITDNQGNMHYAQNLEQHNANVAKYLR